MQCVAALYYPFSSHIWKKTVPAASDMQFWMFSSPSCAIYQQEKYKEQQFPAADLDKDPSVQWSYTEIGLTRVDLEPLTDFKVTDVS